MAFSFAGEQGVSAYGIIMYTNFVFIGIFMGYSMGAAPIAGYNLGAAVLILPVFFGLNGVWAAIVVAEGCAFVFSLYCLLRYRNRYHYV